MRAGKTRYSIVMMGKEIGHTYYSMVALRLSKHSQVVTVFRTKEYVMS